MNINIDINIDINVDFYTEGTGEGSGSTGETGTACCGGGRGASSHRAPLVPQKLWGCRWRRPLPSSSSGRFVRVAAALVYPSFFSISVSNPLSSFVLSRLQPYPAPRRSPSFLVFDRPRAYIHERAVVFSENFGGPALRPRARRPGACLRGIAPGLRRDRAGSLAARRRAPVVSLAGGGDSVRVPNMFILFFC